jgi:hypothetical protein
MLEEIFKKEDAPVCEIPAEFNAMIEKARNMGLTYEFSVIRQSRINRCSSVDLCTYNQVTIIINTVDMFTGETRTLAQQLHSLAHELAHCFHLQDGQNYNNMGLQWCENFAESFSKQLEG